MWNYRKSKKGYKNHGSKEINEIVKILFKHGGKEYVHHLPTNSVFVIAKVLKPMPERYVYRGLIGLRIFAFEPDNRKNSINVVDFINLLENGFIKLVID